MVGYPTDLSLAKGTRSYANLQDHFPAAACAAAANKD